MNEALKTVPKSIGLHTKDILKDWTDLWFNENKKTGYIATTYNFKRHFFFGYNDIDKLKEFTENQYKRFISVNAFDVDWANKDFSRSSEYLKQIRNIGIDIDQYKNNYSIDEALDEIQSMILSNIIPEPNLVLKSRGIQLFYSIDKGASPEMDWLVSYITEQLISKLHFLGADYNCKDLSRVMRVPNSINERNNAKIKAEIWNNEAYTLRELQEYCRPLEIFETRRKKKFMSISSTNSDIGIRIMRFYRTNNARISDLRKLIEIRKGNLTNCRNVFIYVLAYHQSLVLNTKADVLRSVMHEIKDVYTTEKKAERMTKSWIEKTVKSAYDDAKEFFQLLSDNAFIMIYRNKDNIKRPYKNSNLIKKLNITEHEQRQLRSIRNSNIAKEQHAKYMREKRLKDGTHKMNREEYEKNRQQKKEVLFNKVVELKEKGYKQKEIAEELSISKGRVSQILKKFNGA